MPDDPSPTSNENQPVRHRVSIIATLCFTAMMIAVYFLGVNAFEYEPVTPAYMSETADAGITPLAQ